MMRKIFSLIFILFLAISFCYSQDFPDKKEIYKQGWIDLNKNNKKDIYEDPTQAIEKRVGDLLSKMNLNEKTCQMVTLYGWKRVLKDSIPTKSWLSAIWKDGIANIDEHLNGFANIILAEKEISPLVTDISSHVWAMNETQRFFIEYTRLGIPADFTNEGIRGIEAYKATGFPTQLNMGMTWNKDLIYQMGQITAKEARALGYTHVYAPILDVVRDQRWGRIEESYGESPFLVASLGVQMAKGIQSQNVASTAKHFAVYSANKGAREGEARTDPQVAPREVEDIMLYPFRKVIKEANLMGVMSSYNDYDGVPVSGSSYWLIKRLRQDMGFKGYVVSDSEALEYLASKHKVATNLKDAVRQAFMAGMNVRTTFRTPDSIAIYLRELVQENKIPIDTINKRVADVLRVKFRLGLFDAPYVKNAEESKRIVNNIAHHETALQASRESIVLLKNENSALPLNKNIFKKIAIIGPNATDADYAHTHYGPLRSESINILQGMENKFGKENILYAKGCELVDKTWPESEILPQDPTSQELTMIQEAVQTAKSADAVVLVLGGNTKTAGESKSRTSLDLTGHQLLLAKEIKKTGKPVVVVFISSLPITFNWIDKNIDGIVFAGYPGVQGGTAVADVLAGDYNPGGKLTLTFPKSVGQIPMNFPTKPNAQSDQGESAKVKGMLYPFGHGLSYSKFEYSNLIIKNNLNNKGSVDISVQVKNTGVKAGDEVVQLYTRDVVSSVTTYEKNLRGFERIHLNAGESKNISFTLSEEDFKLWNRDMQHVVEHGEFKIMAGSSSEDIRVAGSFVYE